MSEKIRSFVDKAKEAAGSAVEKAEGFVDKAKDMVESGELKEKAREAVESAKEKAEDIAGTVKEKAAPVIDKVKDAASDAVDAVKEGVNRIATGEKPALNVKNELFDELGEKASEQKAAFAEKADELQQKLQELMNKDKD